MARENEIKKYMEKLDISRAEAIQLIEDDKEDFIGEEGEEMTKKAAQNGTKADAQRKPRKPSTRVRKVDEEKGTLLKAVNDLIQKMGAENLSLKTETELSFIYNGNSYTFKLTKHKPKKGVSV